MIPHWRYEWLDHVSEDVAVVLGGALRRIAQAVMLATGATAYNVLQNHGAGAGQEARTCTFTSSPKTLTAWVCLATDQRGRGMRRTQHNAPQPSQPEGSEAWAYTVL